jgi:ZIP family zinc transporter/zinc and cadmium transporter
VTGVEMTYAIAAAGANVLGAVAVAWRAKWSVRALETMIAFAAGFMLSVAMIEILPEAIAQSGRVAAAAVLAGYLLVHLTQHTFVHHFHFGEETHQVTSTVGISALAGLMLHTFFDGVAIASAFRIDATVGALVFIAVLLHKLPEGLAISSIFLAAGASRRRALAAAALLGLTTIVGAVMTEQLGFLRVHGLGLSAGVMLYVGASNLVPEFQAKRAWSLQLTFFAGCALFVVARLVAQG